MSKKSRSKLWFLVHSWLALPIWFFVLIVCVTGTLAVVSPVSYTHLTLPTNREV